nr:putative ribonuclease H-like domain-containing protein [Tanacetum cinerariifolium]
MHIDIRYHFIKEQVEQGVIQLYFINTEYQLADLFTKALGRDRIEFLTNKLGMRSFTPETLKNLMNEDDKDFKLKDYTNVLLRTPRQHYMYFIDLNNIVPHKDLTCLVGKASADESILWHRRLDHLNFKTMNKLVRHNLVKGLPFKCFENDHTCVVCLKGSSIRHLARLIVTDDFSRFTWTFFLKTKDETSGILRNFITETENLKELKVKIISKAFMVLNKRTKKVEENLHVDFLEKKLIKKGAGPNWLFDIDTLTNSINYVPVVVAGTSSTNFSGTKDAASQDVKKDVSSLRYIALPNWFHEAHLGSSTSNAQDACNADAPKSYGNSNPTATSKNPPADQMDTLTVKSTIPIVSLPVLTACLETSPETTSGSRLISNTGDINGVEADLGNMEYNISASLTPTFRIHKDHPKSQIIAPVDTLIQTRHNPKGVRPIGTKWVLKNKKDERGIVIRNKARLVAQGHTQEEGIDYEEVFAPVTRIEAIRLFLACASFMGFTVYQMDVKSAFLYGTIADEVYVMQSLGFQDPEFPDRVYKVENAMNMATTIEQQIALDESLVPSTQRLRIRRSNFRLPLDIQSKEATLQVVYDVLLNSPIFRAFQVTADVPEIYMQEFWATAKLHQNSIRFKIDTRKSVLDLEAFREMLHISTRIPNQPFADLPTKEEILDFLRFLGHSHDIRYLTDVNVNKLYQPWR